MYPHGHFQPMRPVPQKSTALYWVLGSFAVVLVIGGAGCAVCAGLFAVGTVAQSQQLASASESAAARKAARGQGAPAADDEDDPIANYRAHEAASAAAAAKEHGTKLPEGQAAAGGVHTAEDDGTDREPAGGWPYGSASAAPQAAPAAGGAGNYVCTAFTSFRHCGFAGACGPRSASGTGTGSTEAAARAMALNACSGSASAQGGGGAICSITGCRRM
jgi:hypothetical protein